VIAELTVPDRPFRVMVTDAERGSAVAIIRSLGRKGMQVVAASSVAGAAGFRSRYTMERLEYPSPSTRPAAAVEAIVRAAAERKIDLVIPVTDQVIVPLAGARSRLEGVAALALPDTHALEAARDKLATEHLAASLGIPTPRTVQVTSVDDAIGTAPGLGWPVVLKPQNSLAYREGGSEPLEVRYANDARMLAAQFTGFNGRSGVLLQEYCEGEAFGVEVLAHEGRILAAFQHRRLREVPITGGPSSFRESVALDPLLYDYAERFLGALGWTGLAMVEFKTGRDGPRLMEINGRVWGSLPLAVKSGMDFPARLADLYLVGPPASERLDTAYRVGVRSRNLQLEVVWIASVLRARRRYGFLPAPGRAEAITAALRLVNPRDGYDAFEGDDLGPAWAEIAATIRLVGAKVAGSSPHA
jgi:predicted ATP-grasp superfamily ATP-dependent carboligase